MDEIISLILHGCKLAKDLESNLPNQPEILSKLCEEIIRVFLNAKGRLSVYQQDTTSYPHHMLFREPQELQQQQNFDPSLQKWLQTSCPSAMETLFHQTQGLMAERSALGLIESTKVGGEIQMGSGDLVIELGSRSDVQELDASDSGRGSSSSSQRSRIRKNDAEKKTVRVPVQQFGNTEIPTEDGFSWRKYGQKEILGSRFPRAYYRCTNQKLYNCPAKRQVQRVDDDPSTFEVVYRGEHTCHMPATAPSVPPPAPEITQEMAQTMTGQPQPYAATSLVRWLEFSLGSGGSAGSSSSSMAAGSSSGGAAGHSTVGRYGKEVDYPIIDMVDAMFNSCSSSTNSMELIFPSILEGKWDQPSDKKIDRPDRSSN